MNGVNLVGRTAIVTGANSGIGFETALELSRAGAHVILACRSKQKGNLAVQSIKKSILKADLKVVELDLSDLNSIKLCATLLKNEVGGVDLLVNNGGIMGIKNRAITKQGFEAQFGTNYLGHFAFTGLLLPLLLSRPGARVITVSALRYKAGDLNFEDLHGEKHYSPFGAYSQSKLGNLLFSLELHRRLTTNAMPVVSIAVHPGLSSTKLFLNGPAKNASSTLRIILKGISKIIGQSPARGALPTLFAATSADAVPGAFYGPDGFKELWGNPTMLKPVGRALDTALAKRLWEVSEKLTGVDFL